MVMAGMVGMSESEFWHTSLRYLAARLEGFYKRQEMEVKTAYEIARYNAMQVMLPHLPKGSLEQETDLGKFYWELTDAEKKALENADTSNEVDSAALRAMQDKVELAIKEGRIKWENADLKDIR